MQKTLACDGYLMIRSTFDNDFRSRSSEFLFSMTIEIRLSDGISKYSMIDGTYCLWLTNNNAFFGYCREIRILWHWTVTQAAFWVAKAIASSKCSLFSFSRNEIQLWFHCAENKFPLKSLFWQVWSALIIAIIYHIKSVDTFMLTSLAPHSLLLTCKESVLRANLKASMSTINFMVHLIWFMK